SYLGRERAARFHRDLVTNACSAAPGEEFADPPRRLPSDGEIERGVGRLDDLVRTPVKPGGLGPRHRDRADPRELSGRLRERPGLVEQRPNLRVTPPRPDEREDGQR